MAARNCIIIGRRVSLLNGPTVQSLYCELDYKAAGNAGIDAYLLLREPSDTRIDDLIQGDVPEHKKQLI